jgi:hypothetical protein
MQVGLWKLRSEIFSDMTIRRSWRQAMRLSRQTASAGVPAAGDFASPAAALKEALHGWHMVEALEEARECACAASTDFCLKPSRGTYSPIRIGAESALDM